MVPQEMRQWVLSLAPNVAPFSSTFYQTKSINILILFGERAGTRTLDLLIKSQFLSNFRHQRLGSKIAVLAVAYILLFGSDWPHMALDVP